MKEYEKHVNEGLAVISMAMFKKMMASEHKGSWRGYTPGQIRERIQDEWWEMRDAYEDYADKTRGSRERLQGELVDLANTCMMMYDYLEQEKIA